MPTVLITGAARGIGRAAAEHMAASGWDVYAGVRSDADATAVDGDRITVGKATIVYRVRPPVHYVAVDAREADLRFSLVRINVPLGTAETVAPAFSASLRDADVLVRWEADELLALLPATDRPGAERAAQRLRAAVDADVALGAAHWVGDTVYDLLARADPRLH